jgi:hypothetical protein
VNLTLFERDPELADRIFEGLCAGGSTKEVCQSVGVGERVLYRSMARDAQLFDLVMRGRALGTSKHYDEILELTRRADETNFNSIRLKIWSLQWICGRMMPKLYGESSRQYLTGDVYLHGDAREAANSARERLLARLDRIAAQIGTTLAARCGEAIAAMERHAPLDPVADHDRIIAAVEAVLDGGAVPYDVEAAESPPVPPLAPDSVSRSAASPQSCAPRHRPTGSANRPE